MIESVRGASLVQLTLIAGENGSLVVGERPSQLPFTVERIFTLFDIPEGEVRGTHAHRHCEQFLICQRGSVTAVVDDGAFDVVIDGVALLHIPPWREAIAEYRRVASRFVVLHGLTLSDHETVAFGKYAYGQPSREFILNRADVVAACEALGLRLVASLPGDDYDLTEYLGVPTVSETWVLAV